MRKFIGLAAAAAITLITGALPALADGMPGKRSMKDTSSCCCDVANFGGWYIGVHGGFASLTATLTDRDGFYDRASVSDTEDGGVLGAQIGWNYQNCNFVWGVEADIAAGFLDNKHTYSVGEERANRSLDWLASIRTKTGLAMGNILIYATGGVAFAKINLDYSNYEYDTSFSISGTKTGWVAGFGTEYAWSDRVRITGDFLYYDFATKDGRMLYSDYYYRFDEHNSIWVSRIGLNVSLGAHRGHEPLK